jgi:cysteine desulfurase
VLYLDHAATTMVRPEVREAMAPFLDEAYGNPSGIHGVSRRAKNAMEETRERAGELLGASRPLEIVFTGGGTEADNLAVAGAVLAGDTPGGVVTAAIEHEAVLATAAFVEKLGAEVAIVGVDDRGCVDPADVVSAVTDRTSVVSVMAANNETGVIQSVAAIAEALDLTGRNVPLHTDAVQAFISEDITVESTRAAMISIAAHKLGGPKGVGLLYVRNGIDLEPVLHGGGQELGRRSGTHNVAGIVGLGAAMEAAVEDRTAFRLRVGAARDRLEAKLNDAFPDLEITAGGAPRLVQHLHVRFPGVSAETLLIRLDQAGIAAAAGSACHSGAVEVSHVLAAMGMGEQAAAECVRFSFGWNNTAEDGDRAAAMVIPVVEALR